MVSGMLNPLAMSVLLYLCTLLPRCNFTEGFHVRPLGTRHPCRLFIFSPLPVELETRNQNQRIPLLVGSSEIARVRLSSRPVTFQVTTVSKNCKISGKIQYKEAKNTYIDKFIKCYQIIMSQYQQNSLKGPCQHCKPFLLIGKYKETMIYTVFSACILYTTRHVYRRQHCRC